MDTNVYCEQCKKGNFLISKTEGRLSGMFCEKCKSWAVVTSEFSEMEMDSTIYNVFFKFTDILTIDELKFWSHILEINLIQFKKGVLNNTEFRFSGNATQVYNLLNRTNDTKNVSYYVEPNFPFMNN